VFGGSLKHKQARCNPAPRELATAKALERSGYRRWPHGESINGHIRLDLVFMDTKSLYFEGAGARRWASTATATITALTCGR
jgi:hypothetical protein